MIENRRRDFFMPRLKNNSTKSFLQTKVIRCQLWKAPGGCNIARLQILFKKSRSSKKWGRMKCMMYFQSRTNYFAITDEKLYNPVITTLPWLFLNVFNERLSIHSLLLEEHVYVEWQLSAKASILQMCDVHTSVMRMRRARELRSYGRQTQIGQLFQIMRIKVNMS